MVFVRDFKKEFYDIVQHQVCVTELYKLIGCGYWLHVGLPTSSSSHYTSGNPMLTL